MNIQGCSDWEITVFVLKMCWNCVSSNMSLMQPHKTERSLTLTTWPDLIYNLKSQGIYWTDLTWILFSYNWREVLIWQQKTIKKNIYIYLWYVYVLATAWNVDGPL
jgi:hypothetical protein